MQTIREQKLTSFKFVWQFLDIWSESCSAIYCNPLRRISSSVLLKQNMISQEAMLQALWREEKQILTVQFL